MKNGLKTNGSYRKVNKAIERCPHCGFDLDDGDIFDRFLEKFPGDFAKALEEAADFGWTKEEKKRFSKKIGFYDLEKDCTTHYICPNCKEELDE